MFIIAITNSEITIPAKIGTTKQFQLQSSFITLATDNLLADMMVTQKGFSIIESVIPIKGRYDDFDRVILSRVFVDTQHNTVEIHKPTISGRPMYYYVRSGEFYCSTHISLLRKFGVPIEENTEVLPEFFVYRYVMPPNTLYKDIKQVVPGESLRFTFSNRKCTVIESLHFDQPQPSSRPTKNSVREISRKVSDLLSDSIRSVKPTDLNIALLLSGGLDSSILFKLSNRILKINKTFSTGYPFGDLGRNIEKEYALSASDALGSEHTYLEFSVRDYLRGFIEAIDAAEEPLHHLQSVMFYLLFKKGLSNELQIIINGQGADGIFGLGLNNFIFKLERYRLLHLWSLLATRVFVKLMALLTRRGGRLFSRLDELKNKKINNDIDNPNNILWTLGAIGSEQWVMKYFKVTQRDIIRGRLSAIKQYKGHSIFDLIFILDLTGDVAVTQSIWSKLGERNGKILYYPFTAIELLKYSYSIPLAIKFQKPKNVLRHVAKLLQIPEFIITRKKSGFSIDAKYWAVKGGTFDPLIPLCDKIFKKEEITKMQSTDPKKSMIFWNMLNYAIWKRLFIYQEPVSNLVEELNANT